MPITAITFLIGVLAISGVNFLSGYFSKDAILLGAYNVTNMLNFSLLLYAGAILFYLLLHVPTLFYYF